MNVTPSLLHSICDHEEETDDNNEHILEENIDAKLKLPSLFSDQVLFFSSRCVLRYPPNQTKMIVDRSWTEQT